MWLIVNILGVLVLFWLLFKLLALLWRLLWPYVLARPKNLKQLAGDCRWALVTGCTDGIGRAYAQELASRGFSLVLVSRTAQKLEQMEQEFRRRFIKADFLSIPFDFSEPRVEEYRHRLLKHIQHLDIGILVNNVGAAHSYPQRFHDSAEGLEKTADVMTINMFPVTLLTAFVLDQMLKRGKGVVVNISSIAAYSPNFHTALYSATKCFVNWLSAGIRKDYAEHKGIIIQTICPSVVITKMSSMVSEGKKPSFLMPSAEQFARQAIRTIGHAKETCGCLSHQILKEMISLMPQFVVDIFIKKMMLRIRANWHKNHPPF